MTTFDDAAASMPRSFLRPILLLLLAERSSHGYELLEQIAELGLERTDPGGLYRTLRAMEQEGLVGSWWESSTAGPARRRYELTPEGLDWLHASAGSLRLVVRHLERYLERYEALPRGGGHGAHHTSLDPTA
jgi:PadR family transcriptional regulator, regulatory protein PadR